ncbi:winged helix-turn-helix domain-containing protein [Zooshikella marina]|uniref:winged helix-turn-helix domain-containing protein n=1 Tax=Zooshikella ganghwensis TaxID=202772 RepID=UPI001BB00B6A|nr:winged helix-turn-helix domain-containing protein [Zooshikella ganghwensis]MBU2708446.1 winged helix-turn-helix domain-containing protein [Zooshikella ganghwensis]
MQSDTIQFNSKRNVLTCNGEQRCLSHSESKALTLFLAKPNEVIRKEELKRFIWDHAVVTDSSLTKTMTKLRGHLAAFSENHEVIITIPRIGYKLVLDHITIASSTDKTDTPKTSNTSQQVYHTLQTYRYIIVSAVLIVFSFINFSTRLPSLPKGYIADDYQQQTYTHDQFSYSLVTKKGDTLDKALLTGLSTLPCHCTYFVEKRGANLLISFFDHTHQQGHSFIMPDSDPQQIIAKLRSGFQHNE